MRTYTHTYTRARVRTHARTRVFFEKIKINCTRACQVHIEILSLAIAKDLPVDTVAK